MATFSTHSRALRNFQRRLVNSRFFWISVIIHVLLIFIFGSTVLFNKYVEPPDFTGGDEKGFVGADAVTAPPPPPQQTVPTPQVSVSAPATPTASSLSAITSMSVLPASFTLPTNVTPSISTNLDTNMSKPITPSNTAPGQLSTQELQGIQGFTASWAGQGGGGPGTSLRSRQFQFTAFLAKYGDPHDANRGGDWASTVRITNGKVVSGSLPNLLYLITKMSRDKINADPDPVPLDLSSDEMFARKPPFIFFTGHRDFTLTPKEVENLQKYIRLGGCLWGDSSLPGRNSRFDIAFRREMRRVIADKDKDFEPLPATHDIYTSGHNYYPEVREAPSGINFYHEPVYVLRYGGEIAVLYTANDYGDMWQFGMTDQWKFDTREDENYQMVAMNRNLWDKRETYFRNINEPAVKATYQFGTNVIIHLLTRWEDKLKNVPKGL